MLIESLQRRKSTCTDAKADSPIERRMIEGYLLFEAISGAVAARKVG